MLGAAAQYEGDLARAKQLLEESLELWRKIGDQQGISDLLAALGTIARAEGDLPKARELLEQNLSVSRTVGDDFDVAYALRELGWIAAEQGAYDEASNYLREGLEIAMSVGYLEPQLFGAMVEVALGRDRAQDAAVLAGAAEARGESIGAKGDEGWFRLLDRVRAALGAEEYEALYARGHSLEVEDAVRFALACLD